MCSDNENDSNQSVPSTSNAVNNNDVNADAVDLEKEHTTEQTLINEKSEYDFDDGDDQQQQEPQQSNRTSAESDSVAGQKRGRGRPPSK
ncbi:hypothetical protein BLA29_013815, partial [Euroglyphus maynei]